ncbi:MAG: pyridoxamine 5'-phosphate oxidase family protein [Clostridia bacterium]|nr:pyridoxamine 5'-phosphate oxidase family protein [Clostridia bacterium]
MDFGQIERFIARRKISFICSVDAEGFPAVKAMLKPRARSGLREFWFSTNTSSLRVRQFRENPKAAVYFYRKGLVQYTGVLLTGRMEVLTDQEIKNKIWKKGDTVFYKGGVTDPDYCVLKFTAEKGRYYCDLKTESFTVTERTT